jgi:hypothetical protein
VLDQLCTWPAYPDAIVTGHVLASKPTTALLLEQHAALDTMVAAVIVGTDKPAMLRFVLQATGNGGDCELEGVPSGWCLVLTFISAFAWDILDDPWEGFFLHAGKTMRLSRDI